MSPSGLSCGRSRNAARAGSVRPRKVIAVKSLYERLGRGWHSGASRVCFRPGLCSAASGFLLSSALSLGNPLRAQASPLSPPLFGQHSTARRPLPPTLGPRPATFSPSLQLNWRRNRSFKSGGIVSPPVVRRVHTSTVGGRLLVFSRRRSKPAPTTPRLLQHRCASAEPTPNTTTATTTTLWNHRSCVDELGTIRFWNYPLPAAAATTLLSSSDFLWRCSGCGRRKRVSPYRTRGREEREPQHNTANSFDDNDGLGSRLSFLKHPPYRYPAALQNRAFVVGSQSVTRMR
ncbi:hypothetical protein ACOMHN_009896 [Nucella lapillus]